MLHSLSVKDYMATNLVTFRPEQDVLEAIKLMLKHHVSGGPVVDHLGEIVGVLSEKDCLKVALNAGYHGSLSGSVQDFMSTQAVTVDAELSVLEVAKMFINNPYKRFPVTDDNRLVGQISRSDVLRAIEYFAEQSSFA